MKKLLVIAAFVGCLTAVGCMHTHTFTIQDHEVTQLRTWDLIGPSTVGFYEDVDGKLHVYQDSSGNILGQVAQGVGAGIAGERIGDGLKNQEPDQTNITNELSSASDSSNKGIGVTAGAISGSASISDATAAADAKAAAAAGAASSSSSSADQRRPRR
jgi:hypothetical protein